MVSRECAEGVQPHATSSRAAVKTLGGQVSLTAAALTGRRFRFAFTNLRAKLSRKGGESFRFPERWAETALRASSLAGFACASPLRVLRALLLAQRLQDGALSGLLGIVCRPLGAVGYACGLFGGALLGGGGELGCPLGIA